MAEQKFSGVMKVNDVIAAQALVGKKKFKREYLTTQTKKSLKPGGDFDEKTYRNFIINLLTTRGELKQAEAERYADKVGMVELVRAVTHDSWNPNNPRDNYEMYEHLGDTTVNKSTTWYLSRRFPDVVNKGKDGVVIFTRQKNLVTSKPFLAKYCEKIGLNAYIRWRPLLYIYLSGPKKDKNLRNEKSGESEKELDNKYPHVTMDRSMREDTFEALFGCLENLIDNKEGMIGIGGAVCYKILASIYNEEDIPTKLNDLKDPKTKLNEITNQRKWKIKYFSANRDRPDLIQAELDMDSGPKYFGPLSTKIEEEDSDTETVRTIIEQLLAQEVLVYLKTIGIQRHSDDE